jgi:hypothetical protein
MHHKDKQHITVPVFPLNYLVLIGEKKELHIFEARYRELVNDCLKNNACFGIVLPDKTSKGVSKRGVLVRIERIKKTYPSGEMDIVVEGVSIFNTTHYVHVLSPKLYGAATVEILFSEDSICSKDIIDSIKKYFALNEPAMSNIPNNLLISQLANKIPLNNDERLKYISIAGYKAKEDFLAGKIRLLIKLAEIEKKLNGDFWLN